MRINAIYWDGYAWDCLFPLLREFLHRKRTAQVLVKIMMGILQTTIWSSSFTLQWIYLKITSLLGKWLVSFSLTTPQLTKSACQKCCQLGTCLSHAKSGTEKKAQPKCTMVSCQMEILKNFTGPTTMRNTCSISRVYGSCWKSGAFGGQGYVLNARANLILPTQLWESKVQAWGDCHELWSLWYSIPSSIASLISLSCAGDAPSLLIACNLKQKVLQTWPRCIWSAGQRWSAINEKVFLPLFHNIHWLLTDPQGFTIGHFALWTGIGKAWLVHRLHGQTVGSICITHFCQTL